MTAMGKFHSSCLKDLVHKCCLKGRIIFAKLSLFWPFVTSTFKRPEIYFLVLFSVSAVTCSSISFRNSSVLNAWAESFLEADAIINNDYSHYTIQSSAVNYETSDELRRAMSDLTAIHQATYEAMHFLSPVDSRGENVKGSPLRLSSDTATTDLSGISCGVANFGNFNNETVGAICFAGCQLESLFKDSEHLVWTRFPFEGKDASSFISSSLADELIAFDPDDCFSDYESLLGARLSYEFDGQVFEFSINNVYRSTSYLGPAVDRQFDSPIITDCYSLYTARDLALFFSVTDGIIQLRENIYHLSEPRFSGLSFETYFMTKDGGVVESNDSVPEVIKNLYSDYYEPINSSNYVPFFLMVISTLLAIGFGFFVGFRNPSMMLWHVNALGLVFSCFFMIVSGTVFVCLGGGLLSFQVCNPVAGAVGTLLPLAIPLTMGLAIVIRRRLKC